MRSIIMCKYEPERHIRTRRRKKKRANFDLFERDFSLKRISVHISKSVRTDRKSSPAPDIFYY